MTGSGWLFVPLIALGMLGPQAASAKDDLVIGVAQSPSSLHPCIDAEIIKGYILGFAQRPVTSFDRDWKLACLLCTDVPTLDNGLVQRETDGEGGNGLAVTLHLCRTTSRSTVVLPSRGRRLPTGCTGTR